MMAKVRTSAEVDADYKTRVPKFPEKVDWADTEDYVAIGMKRKVLMVWTFRFFLHSTVHDVVLCLYYALISRNNRNSTLQEMCNDLVLC